MHNSRCDIEEGTETIRPHPEDERQSTSNKTVMPGMGEGGRPHGRPAKIWFYNITLQRGQFDPKFQAEEDFPYQSFLHG